MRFARLVVSDFRQLLAQGDRDEIREVIAEFHPADTADLLVALEPDEAAKLVQLIHADDRFDVFEHVPEDVQVEIIDELRPVDAAQLLDGMAADERVDLVAELSEETKIEVIPLLGKEEAQELKQLALYPENTAGGRMTTEFVRLTEDMTVDEAIAHVRAVAEEMETVYYIYALGPHDTLRGVVSLAMLVTAAPKTRLAELMETRVIEVRVDTDQEEVAKILSKYNFLALPVVDDRRRMLGIITVDDVIDVVREEETEDIHRLGAVAPIDDPYLRINFWSLLRKRVFWLALIFVGATLTGTALKYYEGFFTAVPDLVLFLPLLISSGGNSGAQSSTLVIRAMALGEVTVREWLEVLLRELRMGLALGVILGGLGWMRAYFWDTDPTVTLTVALALVGIVLFGNLVGAALPMLLRALRLDPAMASGPFVATFVDISGILIYLGVAMACIPKLTAGSG